MRLFLAMILLLALGCSKSALTIPAASISAYAAGDAVPTEEGVSLSLEDGGRLQPIAKEGRTLTVISRQSVEWAGGTRDMVYLGDGDKGAPPAGTTGLVRDVVALENGENLTILGTRSGLRVNSAYVGGLRVTHSRKNERTASLKPGAIAGITLGAVAGAALLGLGIYGLTQIELDLGLDFGSPN